MTWVKRGLIMVWDGSPFPDDDLVATEKARALRSTTDVDDVAVARRAGGDTSVVLGVSERRRLITTLHAEGLNDCEIAARTGYRPETVMRIRNRIGLPPIPQWVTA